MGTGALVAFTAVSAGMSIVQGIQESSARTEAGIAYMKQAQIAKRENELAIRQKQRDIDETAARQVMAMAKNGMDTGRGTPLEILHKTAVLGQEEIDALKLSGAAQVDYYKSLGNQQFNSGRNAILGGYADALTTVVTTGIKMKTNGLIKDKVTPTASNTSDSISWGKAESGYTVGTSKNGKIYAGLSSGLA